MRKSIFHNAQDEWLTPKYAVDIIMPHLTHFKTIWCPFDKEDSNYVLNLRRLGIKVYATHIDNGQDFLTYKPKFEFDAIVSNPPFSIKNEVLEKCFEYNKPFALLLPFSILFAMKTIKIFDKYPVQFLMTDRRISFNGERPNFGCWYICSNVLPRDLMTYVFNNDPRELYKKENQ